MVSLHQDFRYATRRLRRTPGFTVTAVLTLALGIAAHTAFFSVVNAIAFKRVPVARLDNVYSVQAVRPTGDREPAVSLAGLRALERELPAGAMAVGAVGYNWWPLAQIPGRADEVSLSIVSGGYASAFDLPAQHGRWLTPDDDRDGTPQRVVVISDRLWREWFGADPSIVGRAFLTMAKTPFRILGVAPAGSGADLKVGPSITQ